MKFHRHWTEEMILNHINRRHGREPVNYHHYVINYTDAHAAAIRLFGSWANAVEACGISYNEVRKYRKWSKRKVLEEIRARYKKKEKLSSHYIQNNSKPLYMAAVKRFQSWGRAVKAAGIEYDGIRLRQSLGKEEIRKRILALFHKKESLAYTNMRARYQYLLTAGASKLGNGSWAEARRKCGIKVNYRSPTEKRKLGLLLN